NIYAFIFNRNKKDPLIKGIFFVYFIQLLTISYAFIVSKKAAPYFSSLLDPTPFTSKNSSLFFGLLEHISCKVLSENITNGGTPASSAKVLRIFRNSSNNGSLSAICLVATAPFRSTFLLPNNTSRPPSGT